MRLFVRTPTSPVLKEHIDKLWFCEAPDAAGEELVAPTGAAQIVIPLAENSSAPLIAGVFTGPQRINAADQRMACGVVLRMGHSDAFLNAPLASFTDQHPALDPSIWSGSPHIAERLVEKDQPDPILSTLEQILVQSVNTDWRADPTLTAGARLLDRGVSVGTSLTHLGADRRRFGRKFTRNFGVGPKHFARIRRFQVALRTVRTSPSTPLGQLAADLGYSDQAHMTREFREFSSSTPSAVHGEVAVSPGHFAA